MAPVGSVRVQVRNVFFELRMTYFWHCLMEVVDCVRGCSSWFPFSVSSRCLFVRVRMVEMRCADMSLPCLSTFPWRSSRWNRNWVVLVRGVGLGGGVPSKQNSILLSLGSGVRRRWRCWGGGGLSADHKQLSTSCEHALAHSLHQRATEKQGPSTRRKLMQTPTTTRTWRLQESQELGWCRCRASLRPPPPPALHAKHGPPKGTTEPASTLGQRHAKTDRDRA